MATNYQKFFIKIIKSLFSKYNIININKYMNYQNIHKVKLTHSMIADYLGYKNVNSFRCSSSHKRIMNGIDKIIKYTNEYNKQKRHSNSI